MKRKTAFAMVLLAFLFSATIMAVSVSPVKAFTPTPVIDLNPLPTVYIDPSTTEAPLGVPFNVSIYVSSTSTNPTLNMSDWVASLQWNSNVLSLISFTWGNSSLGQVGNWAINNSVPEQTSKRWMQNMLGSGAHTALEITSPLLLLTATFQGISIGSSPINLIDVMLINASDTSTTTYDRSPDVNGDGSVDMFDVGTMAPFLYTTRSSPNWNPNYDLDDNGVVNVIDLRMVINNFLLPPLPVNTILEFAANVQNCSVSVRGLHDVSVDGVAFSKTVVGRGFGMNVGIRAANRGNFTEAFNVTVYANTTIIGTLSFSLASGGSSTHAWFWNASGLAYGNYSLMAAAELVPNEDITTNNNCTAGWVRVSVVGDVTSSPPANPLDLVPDGQVDMADVGVVASLFNQPTPPAPWNCDISSPGTLGVPDGLIDMADIGTVAAHFGEHE